MRPPRNPLASWSLSLISRDAVLSAMPVGLTTRFLTFRGIFVCTPTSLLMVMAFADTPGPTKLTLAFKYFYRDDQERPGLDRRAHDQAFQLPLAKQA